MKVILIISILLLMMLCACGEPNISGDTTQEGQDIPEAAFETEAPADDLTPLEKEALYQADTIKAFFKMKSYFKKSNTEDSEDNMPANYGGTFINDEGILNICVVELNDAAKELYYTACDTKDIMFQEVNYSLKELEAGMDALTAAMKAGQLRHSAVRLILKSIGSKRHWALKQKRRQLTG